MKHASKRILIGNDALRKKLSIFLAEENLERNLEQLEK